jgi:hypothetical protein
VAEQQKNLVWEGTMETAPRLDRRTDDHELRAPFGRDARHVLAEAPRPRTDDLATHTDAVGSGHRSRGLEPLLDAHELPVEMRVDRELAFQDGGRNEHDSGAAVGGNPAGEVDRVLRLRVVEQRDDDRAVRDRARPAREAPRTAVEEVEVRESHRISWYGTEARITWGSTSSRRFT